MGAMYADHFSRAGIRTLLVARGERAARLRTQPIRVNGHTLDAEVVDPEGKVLDRTYEGAGHHWAGFGGQRDGTRSKSDERRESIGPRSAHFMTAKSLVMRATRSRRLSGRPGPENGRWKPRSPDGERR